MRRRASLIALALLPLAAAARVRTRAVTMTRFVRVFSELESRLADAMAAGDGAALDALITADFEQREAREPIAPVPRAEWLAGARTRWPAGDLWIEQMAVHDRGDTALVSFLARPEGAAPSFVVDAWVRDGDAWRLKVRYLAPA